MVFLIAMNGALIYLILAGLCVNGMHGYLLATQKSDRKWSISEHAIKNRTSLLLYRLGHFAGGFFFLMFAREFLLLRYDSTLLFVLACVTVLFEYIQAILPAGGKYNTPHSISAYLMWISFVMGGLLGVLSLPLPATALFLSRVVIFVLVGTFIASHFLNRNYVWLMQMAMVMIFFVGLLLMQIP